MCEMFTSIFLLIYSFIRVTVILEQTTPHHISVLTHRLCMLFTLVSMSVSSSLGPFTSSSMLWPHTRPISSSSSSRSTQSATLLNSIPSSSQVNMCCSREAWKHNINWAWSAKGHICLDNAAHNTSTLYWNLSIVLFTDAAYSLLCTVRTNQSSVLFISDQTGVTADHVKHS